MGQRLSFDRKKTTSSPVILPTELWEIVLSYSDQGREGQSQYRFLSRAISSALDEVWVHEVDRMHELDMGVIKLYADAKPKQMKRMLLALTRAPPETMQSIHTIAGRVTQNFWRGIPESLTYELFNFLTRLPSLGILEGPFLFQMALCPKRVDLSGTCIQRIGDEFLSCSGVEELHLPSTLVQVGSNFLLSTRIKRLDLSGTGLVQVGYRFVCDSPIEEVLLPRTLMICRNLSFLRGSTTTSTIDLSNTFLEAVGDEFLESTAAEKIILPQSLRSGPHGFLRLCRSKRIDLSGSCLESVGADFLFGSTVECILLPATLKVVGHRFLSFARVSRIDLSCSFLEKVGDDFLAHSPVEKVILPRTLTVVGDRFLSSLKTDAVDLSETFLRSIGTRSLTNREGKKLQAVLPETLRLEKETPRDG